MPEIRGEMHVIAKRTIMFLDHMGQAAGRAIFKPHTVHFSKDIQEIPDWISEQEAFKIATQPPKDGKGTPDITVVRIEAPARVPVLQKFEGDAVVDLEKMNKAELQTHAREVHGIELDDKLKKDEMIAAIKDKAAK